MAEYNEVFDFFKQTLMESLWKNIVPIYRMTGKPPRADFVGSSVYCQYGPAIMLLTARHVFDRVLPYRAWYPYSMTEMRELPCKEYKLAKQASQDSAVVVLDEGLPMWSPISSSRLGLFNAGAEYQHILVGYPGSSTRRSRPEAQRIEIKGYLSSAVPLEEYPRLSVDPEREFAVIFYKENVYERDLKKLTFPDPNGMSGGAVFQFHEKAPRILSVVGLMTSWRQKAIIATRIESITSKFRFVRKDETD